MKDKFFSLAKEKIKRTKYYKRLLDLMDIKQGWIGQEIQIFDAKP